MSNRDSRRQSQPHQHSATTQASGTRGTRRQTTTILTWGGVSIGMLALAFTFGLMFGGFGGALTDEDLTPSPTNDIVAGDATPDGANDDDALDPPMRDLPSRWDRGTQRTEPVPVAIEPEHIDFGTVGPGEVFPILAKLTNTSDETLRIATSHADCGCTTVDMAGKFILPGETIELEATFDSQSRLGNRTAVISVIFEGYANPVRIPVSAIVQ